MVCSIGTTDPTAAAGLFRDAFVYAELGVRAAFVVAGVSAQNDKRVSRIDALEPAAITAQLRDVWAQTPPGAVRIGLIPGRAAMKAVARFLSGLAAVPPIVVDPVMSATSGKRFVNTRDLPALRALLRLAAIATPNALEASKLAAMPVRTIAQAEQAALRIARLGCAALVTGGHIGTGARIVDVLAQGDSIVRFSSARLPGAMRGTGCTLAAAIAAGLAQGATMQSAVRSARRFVRSTFARRGSRRTSGVNKAGL